MAKYDFGYEIQPGTTTAWARDCIPAGSLVLEFGPSIGYLTKALREKSCKVDIVEIDNESGALAAQFAEKALYGAVWGDVESLKWCDEFLEASYDAIVFLDVLEHLHDPEKILSQALRFLKPDGRLYLSVPNIAHNSIIINLFNNKWEYTELGLLDNTHIHFFTYYALTALFRKLNLTVEYQGAIQKMVGDNEIGNDYSDVPMELAAALKERQFPDAYQFLFCLSQKQSDLQENPQTHELELNKLPNTGMSVELNYQYHGVKANLSRMTIQYYPGPCYSQKIFIPCESNIRPNQLVVGFPFHCSIVSGFTVSSVQDGNLLSWVTNGIQLENGDLLFSGHNNQINISLPPGTRGIDLQWNVLFYDSNVISYMNALLVDKRNDAEVKQILDEKNRLEELLNESRMYAQTLVDSVHAERGKSSVLEKHLGESQAYARELLDSVHAEQNKSRELEKLLDESRIYAQSLVASIHAEQSKSAELEVFLSESRSYAQSLAEDIRLEREQSALLNGQLEEFRDVIISKTTELDRIYQSRWWKLFKHFFENNQ